MLTAFEYAQNHICKHKEFVWQYIVTMILHTKMSNKRFIIQRSRFPKILTCQRF